MRRPRAKSRCANGRMDDYRFAIAVGRWPGIRFHARLSVPAARSLEAKAKKQKPLTPKADHPWRQAYRKMRPWSKPGTAAPVSLIQEMSG